MLLLFMRMIRIKGLNMKKYLLLILAAITLSACTKNAENTNLKIVTSFFPYYNMTELLIDETTELDNIMPLNMEVHDFEPTAKDIARLEEADLLIVHGFDLEDWLDTVLESLNNKDLKVVYMSEGIELKESDPHTWLSPENGKKQFTAIKDALIALNPDSKDHYETQYETHIKEFEALIEDYSVLSTYSGNSIVVDHLAYAYLLEPFNITQRSVMSSFHSGEPSAKQIEEIIELIKNENIHSIYSTKHSETNVNDILLKETDVELLELNTLEIADTNDTYISLMQSNLTNLIKGLSD